MTEIFKGRFTQQEPIPEVAIAAALEVLRHGRLHRYNTAGDEPGEVTMLEQEFAALIGRPYCLAVASGGYALGCALRAHGVGQGMPVLTNAFTLAPVPGAIVSVGALPVFVETTEALTIDLEHLEHLIATTTAKVLLLSHMRGHQPDMQAVMALCNAAGVTVIEDCAHTMGGGWGGQPSGTHGTTACYSTQTYKHVNSGEGGLIVTADPEVAARAIYLSGSYMLHGRHRAAPPERYFKAVAAETPNISGRMDNLRAAILRPQLAHLAEQVARWATLHDTVEHGLADTPGLALIRRDPQATRVGSSFQCRLPGWSERSVRDLLARCLARGVELKWFGADHPSGYTSRYDHWRYAVPVVLPRTDRILRELIDMRLPLTFSVADCAQIARILRAEVMAVHQAGAEVPDAAGHLSGDTSGSVA